MAPDISVVIPTQARPARLVQAARSVLAQKGVDFDRIEVVVVDNDPAATARRATESAAAGAPCAVFYVPAPTPGVAFARNAGLRAARGRFIAFLDDDQEAPAGWLAALLAAQAALEADVVFGAIAGRAPETVVRHRDYFEYFFGRTGPAAAGRIPHPYGCGNSLIRRAALPRPEPFDPACNRTGGEDDVLFSEMQDQGAVFAWSPEAWVWEEAPPSRLTLAYTFKRAFAYGQGPAQTAWQMGRLDKVAFWMAVGAAQTLIHGADAALRFALGRGDRAFAADRAFRGLGKVLWFPPFQFAFYGRPSAAADPATAAQPA